MATYQTDTEAGGDTGIVIGSLSNRYPDAASAAAGDNTDVLYDYGSWFLFTDVAIAQGSTIDTAYLQCYAVSSDGTAAMKIDAHDADTGSPPTTFAEYGSRPRTDANVEWDPSAWSAANWYDSDSIVSIIQEIVDREGWESGNDILIFCDNATGAGWGGSKDFLVWINDATPSNATKLVVTHTEPVQDTALGFFAQMVGGT